MMFLRLRLFAVAVVIVALVTASPSLAGGRRMPQSQPRPHHGAQDPPPFVGDHIVIHVVAHTHDDVGWLKTVDEYYVEEVKWILDTSIRVLLEDPKRKFTYVEIAYFERWWHEQTETMKASVRKLVDNGQLEFNLGGWCMNDEAAAYYAQEIDQQTEGMQLLLNDLGAKPFVGWHVDPFGHSASTPSMWAQMGMSGFGLNRIDYRLKQDLMDRKELEFVWRSSSSLNNTEDMWIHVMPYHYCTPGECGYDGGLNINTDSSLPTYGTNYVSQGENFVAMARQRSSLFRHNQVLVPFGCDFAHQNAFHDFLQLEQLLDYVTSNSTYNATAIFSTFGDYVTAVHAQNVTWPLRTPSDGDFFPYADHPHAYWTGYYTSRPALKGLIRDSGRLLRVAEQLYGLSALRHSAVNASDAERRLTVLRRAQGVTQHHDAVTGTEKQHVSDDYTVQLSNGWNAVSPLVEQMIAASLNKGSSSGAPSLTLDSSSASQQLQPGNFAPIVLHNRLGWSRHHFVAINVTRSDVIVVDAQGKLVASQINPILSLASGKPLNATFRLYFRAQLPPASSTVFFLTIDASRAVNGKLVGPTTASMTLQGDLYEVNFSNGNISSIKDVLSNRTHSMKQDYQQYVSAAHSEQASGAYVFRPEQSNVLGIGSDNDPNHPVAKATWTFIEPYPSRDSPVVFTTPMAAGSYNDTFAATVRGDVSDTQFSVSVARVDTGHPTGDPWGQSIAMGFLNLDAAHPPAGSLMGSEPFSATSGQAWQLVKVAFSSSFKAEPTFLVSVRGTQECDDVFAPTPFNVTVSGAMVNVSIESGDSWSQKAYLDWLAVPANTTSGGVGWSSAAIGSVKVTVTATEAVTQVVVPFTSAQQRLFLRQQRGGVASSAPVVIASVEASDGSIPFATTSVGSSYANATVNVAATRGDMLKPGTKLTLHVLAFAREMFTVPVGDGTPTTSYVTGPFVSEAHQLYRSDYAATVVRVFSFGSLNSSVSRDDISEIQFEHVVGPLDQGREIVARYFSDLDNSLSSTQLEFFTDDNGLEMQRRVSDLLKDEPVSGNYFPVSQRAFLKSQDNSSQMTLMAVQAHGGSSLMPGHLELMMHRRCLVDDGYGVGEVLNEQDRVAATIYMILASPSRSTRLHRRLAYLHEDPVMVLVATSAVGSIDSWKWSAQHTDLSAELPANVHLLTLSARNATDDHAILRLQHVYALNEDAQMSLPVTIDLSRVFVDVPVPNATELTLSANAPLSSVHRLAWKTETVTQPSFGADSKLDAKLDEDTEVTLQAREIRTFRV